MSWKEILKGELPYEYEDEWEDGGNSPPRNHGEFHPNNQWSKKMTKASREEVGTKKLIAVGWLHNSSGKKVYVYDNTGFEILFPFVLEEDWD